MKKEYNIKMLSLGIIVFVLQLASFTLQRFWGKSVLTLSVSFELILFFIISVLLIIQFSEYQRVIPILLVIHSVVSLVNVASSIPSEIVAPNNISEVLFVLLHLIAIAILIIGSVFTLTNNFTGKIKIETAKKIVSILVATSFILLMIAAILKSSSKTEEVLTSVFYVLALSSGYFTLFFGVTSVKQRKVKDFFTTRLQIENLYKKGEITKEEYEERINKKSN